MYFKFALSIHFVMLLILVGCPAPEGSSTSGQSQKGIGEPFDIKNQSIEAEAPEFSLIDLNGDTIRLSDYRGKVVLLVFSTTWCPHCIKEIPHLKKLHNEYHSTGLEILHIDVQEGKEKVGAFADKHSLPYKVLLDEKGTVASAYGVRGIPTTFLVNKEGIILCRACRSLDTLLNSLLEND